jgi:hypothetical protein
MAKGQAKVKAKRPPPRIVVSNKGGHSAEVPRKAGSGAGGRTKVVDRRMKSARAACRSGRVG